MTAPKRDSLVGIIGGLMLSENMGDVHDEIILLCQAIGIEPPEGGFGEWTARDSERFLP